MPFRPPEKLIMGKARPTFGSEFGTGLGQGIGQVLQNKLKQMQLGQAYKQMGLPSTIAQFDPQTQREFVKRYAGSQGNQAYSQAIGHVSRGEEIPPEIQSQLQPNQLLELEKFRSQQQEQKRRGEQEEEKIAISLIGDKLKQIQDEAERGKRTKRAHEQIIDLVRTGNVRSGKWYQLLSLVGLQDFWQNPTTQVTKALMDQLAQGAAIAFNTKRLTNLEVGLYRGSLEQLRNTPEGIEAIARNSILEIEAMEAKDQARRQVLRENKGRITRDMEDRIDAIVEPKLRELSEQAFHNLEEAAMGQQERLEGGQGSVGLGSFEERPPAKDYRGTIIENTDTGGYLVSDGTKWVDVKTLQQAERVAAQLR